MKAAWALAFVLAVTPVFAARRKVAQTKSPDTALIERAKTAVRDQLKDPLSAQFRSLYPLVDGEGQRKVCGQVNARNGYGGYGGFQAFAYLTEIGSVIFIPADDDANANQVNRLGSGCGFGPWHR
jgi:hypothetical protein